jgi:hypothetical protein
MDRQFYTSFTSELFGIADIERIMQLDGISKDSKDYDADFAQLWVMCNLWSHFGDDQWRVLLKEGLTCHGLVGFQNLLNACYHTYVTGAIMTGSVDGTMDLDVYFTSLFCGPLSSKGLGEVCKQIAQLTTFAKRFTYISETDPNVSFQKFIEDNALNYSQFDRLDDLPLKYPTRYYHEGEIGTPYNRTPHKFPSTSLINDVRIEMLRLLGDHEIVPFEEISGELSSGSAFCPTAAPLGGKTSRVKADKLRSLVHAFGPQYFGSPVDLYDDRYDHHAQVSESMHHGSEYRPVMLSVPKSLTSRRLICPEHVLMGYYSSRVRKLLEYQLIASGGHSYIRWEDQSINRDLSMLGSANGEWATIDLSAASDLQSREITFAVVPQYLRHYLFNCISDWVVVGGTNVRVKCYSTMGNQTTWLMLGIYCKAIADVGCSWYDDENHQYRAYAEGDDLVVPTVAYRTVCDLLEIFGLKVNRDKSFADGFFRESCGGNYVSGYDVTSKYWRRGPVDIRDFPDFISYLCGLQHRVYGNAPARQFLNAVVTRLDPKVTYSPIGFECDDLWSGYVTVEGCEKSPHRRLTSSKPAVPDYPEWYQRLQYFSFLKFGRKYLTDQDRRYDVSSSYLCAEDFVSTTSRWRVVNPPYQR